MSAIPASSHAPFTPEPARDPSALPVDRERPGAGFVGELLELVSHMVPHVRSALVVCAPPEMAERAAWPAGAAVPAGLAALARRAVLARSSQVELEPLRFACALPEGAAIGAIAVELSQALPSDQHPGLQRLLGWAAAWAHLATRGTEPAASSGFDAFGATARVLGHDSYQAAAFALVSELGRACGADRTSFGVGGADAVKVQALSDNTTFDRRTKLIRALESAMEEAVAQHAVVPFPTPAAARVVAKAHAAVSEEHGDTALVTIPFAMGATRFGALTLERFRGEPFEPSEIEHCQALLSTVGRPLELYARRDRGLLAKLVGSVRESVELTPRGRLKALALAVLACAVFFITVTDGEHRLSANASLQGSFQRSVVAPFDGYIETADHRAGDEVRAGTVLATLQSRGLDLERRKELIQRDELAKQYRRALSQLARADAKILSDQVAQVDARLALIDDQLTRSRLTAPFDGLIVAGDLKRSLGSPVERGQVLFELAPLTGFEVQLDVDERDIAEVAAGQRGELVLTALPDSSLELVVDWVSPVSRLQGGRNVFRADARLVSPPQSLRPGMEGVAKVTAGRRALGWIWFHRLTDWLRLWLWSWWP